MAEVKGMMSFEDFEEVTLNESTGKQSIVDILNKNKIDRPESQKNIRMVVTGFKIRTDESTGKQTGFTLYTMDGDTRLNCVIYNDNNIEVKEDDLRKFKSKIVIIRNVEKSYSKFKEEIVAGKKTGKTIGVEGSEVYRALFDGKNITVEANFTGDTMSEGYMTQIFQQNEPLMFNRATTVKEVDPEDKNKDKDKRAHKILTVVILKEMIGDEPKTFEIVVASGDKTAEWSKYHGKRLLFEEYSILPVYKEHYKATKVSPKVIEPKSLKEAQSSEAKQA
jgi:hypothetical protein